MIDVAAVIIVGAFWLGSLAAVLVATAADVEAVERRRTLRRVLQLVRENRPATARSDVYAPLERIEAALAAELGPESQERP